MRSLRVTAIALVASCAVVLTGCGGDDPEPAANDATASAEESMTPDDEESATPAGTEEADPGEVNDFPDVDGATFPSSSPDEQFQVLYRHQVRPGYVPLACPTGGRQDDRT